MAHDRYIPNAAPGIAGFATESIGSSDDPRFGDGVPRTTTAVVPPSFDGKLYEVVGFASDGITLAKATYTGTEATGALTFTGAGTAGETITIGNEVYTLVAALSVGPAVENEVLIGGTAALTAANLAAAINAGAGGGVVYSATTQKHPIVDASVAGAVVTVTAELAGTGPNSVATTETSAAASWGAATLGSGANDAGGVKAAGILTAPVITGAGQTTTVDIYRDGHWNMDSLVWDASFDSEAKKKTAFQGGVSPSILVSKKKYNSDAIAV
jgi:hypothetical protein